MARNWVTGIAAIAWIAAIACVSDSRADVLYSTIAGATAAGSVQPAYSASLNLNNTGNEGGAVGFGDDYTSNSLGLTGAQINSGAYRNAPAPNQPLNSTDNYIKLTSITYYGDLEPGPDGSVTTLRNGTQLYSEGANISIRFYDPSGVVDTNAVVQTATATSASGTGTLTPSSAQGPGLHTLAFSTPVYVPASGYFVFSPYLASSNNGAIGVSTPTGTVGASFTGYFGAAPTVGSGSGSAFTTQATDPNDENNSAIYTNSTFANIQAESPDSAGDMFTYTPTPSGNPSSGYYEQIEFDGDGLTPEPGSFAIFAAGASGLCLRRRRVNQTRPIPAA